MDKADSDKKEKMHFFAFFFSKNLGISKKSSTFALSNKKKRKETIMNKKTITFESLKAKIKNSFSAYDLIHIHAGEYIFDRMLQMCGKQERAEGGMSFRYAPQQVNNAIYSYIDNVDVRSVDELINFCKEAKIHIPSWLNKSYGIDLTDDGWVLYEK